MENVNIQITIHFNRLLHECNTFRIHAVVRAINRIHSRISISDTYQLACIDWDIYSLLTLSVPRAFPGGV